MKKGAIYILCSLLVIMFVQGSEVYHATENITEDEFTLSTIVGTEENYVYAISPNYFKHITVFFRAEYLLHSKKSRQV